MRFDLSHKTAIVTGASQGIGKTIAIEMAKSGAIVFCLARNKEALDATIKKITENGGKATAFSCDISNNDDFKTCLLYTSPSPRDRQKSRMPSSA